MDFGDAGREVPVRLPLNLTAPSIFKPYEIVVGPQAGPNLRGTLGIITVCVGVLIFSAFISPHPKIGQESDWTPLRIIKDCRLIKVWVGIGGLVAPEDGLKHAIREYMVSRRHYQKMKDKGLVSSTSRWTMTHSYLLGMDGLQLRFQNGELLVIDVAGLDVLIERGYFSSLEFPTQEEVHDKSKADVLIKVVAAGPVLRFMVQVIARGIQKLPISLLELTTSGYALCTVISYFFWLQKPYRIRIPLVIHCPCFEEKSNFFWAMDLMDDGSGSKWTHKGEQLSKHESILTLPRLAGYIMELLLAGLNLLAWQYPFPTPIEHNMWRILSIIHVVNVGIRPYYDLFESSCTDLVTTSHLLKLLHWVFKLTFFGLTLASIRAGPRGSYALPEWITFIPYIG